MEVFQIQKPRARRVPVLLSVPHCGTYFPEEIRGEFFPELIATPDDTDWFVDRLYDFAPDLGVTTISALLSRWVIDLNRPPDNAPLYSDGRIITGLCPVTTFLGRPLYRDRREAVEVEEVARRRAVYFEPYHVKLQELLNDLVTEFGRAILWDCHSIRQMVPSIQREKFPDLILGSADGMSAHPSLIDAALSALNAGSYTVRHNHPFKGGYITRHYGRPERRVHTLQLEMTKINYMDDGETEYHPGRAATMQKLLSSVLISLEGALSSLKDH